MISLQNLVAKASKINRQVEKSVKDYEKTLSRIDADKRKELCDTWKKKQAGWKLKEYVNDIKTALELRDAIRNLEEETGEQLLHVPQGEKQCYFITVRPDTKKITFTDFYNDVRKFVERKCFIDYKLSFEQKGMSAETLGEGFHVHIVAALKQRSKGEVLRDTQNTFKRYTAPNCIEVLTTKNPAELVENYLVNYHSDDGHKAPTKEWDAQWRTRENLDSLYSNPGGLPIKSILATPRIVTTRINF